MLFCHRNYFYQKCFTRDGSKLIFGGAFEGHWNYYLLDIAGSRPPSSPTGRAIILGGFLSDDDRSLWYVKNNQQLRRVDLASLEEQVVYQWMTNGWPTVPGCQQRLQPDGRHRESKSDWQPLTDWSKFRAFYFTQPECRLINIDLRSGEQRVVLQEKRWLGHPIYRPFDDSTIAFCHEGPRDAIDARMWLINADGSHMRKVRQHQPGESFTHEFWVPDGSALYYVAHQENDPHRYLTAPTRQRWKIAS
jgi:oligogalacturonide lyase